MGVIIRNSFFCSFRVRLGKRIALVSSLFVYWLVKDTQTVLFLFYINKTQQKNGTTKVESLRVTSQRMFVGRLKGFVFFIEKNALVCMT